MPKTKYYFISDLHLGASYIDNGRDHETRVVEFLRAIEGDAKALFLVGDILDYWFEYRTVVPRGYVRFFGQLARMADAGTEIVWFIGNHDIWLFDYLRNEIGITIVNTDKGGITMTLDGTDFFIGHGDTFGRQPRSYNILRSIFHNKVCQKLYSSIHPRWTIPFAHAWSSNSRKGHNGSSEIIFDGKTRAAIEVFARQLSSDNPRLTYIIIGHHHIALNEPINAACRLVMLGNWIDKSTYAVFDGSELRLCEFHNNV
ncbi:MAG: UDP-2,3-diacylglucosamine diphosphatase [Muribaculaceae bacterium]|nr:UDP-2,3-diacylglucosamine diphosphatase [Muribaculaceae bacterium]